ncbi:MAG TPA: thioredoxin [Spirochaetota bacterium]|jgi:thioredoxin 1|nr:thioredoxin [Spirochaetota bacterium]MBP9023804.1 thioredoxin [Spirochaetota bacterium]HOA07943.1 thioredoxin [Spirochaetota bacterium]HOH37960.1 thioredoxin [Spirochaetota bacterium]HPA64101.1 thioredoxin [Spirochaetota bacterium]
MGNVTEIKSSDFESVVLKAEGKVLVDFWAPWCGPCRMQGPILEKVAPSVKAKIVKVNTDESPDIAEKYSISSIPTLIIFEKGQVLEKLVGVQPEPVLIQKLS